MTKHIHLPTFIYGTAWKEDRTTHLVKAAITAGFTAIDIANQPKHYSEALVGSALVELTASGVKREQLFLQTKFTPVSGHNENMPYDPTASYANQVATSFKSSLRHLQTNYVDAYLLHGPHSSYGLHDADWQVWAAIEKIYTAGQAKLIGVSNVNLRQLMLLVADAKIKPMIVQNRCFADQGWDKAVRDFCRANNIIYQGFSLLTANVSVLHSEKVSELAQHLNKTPAQIIFKLAMQIGIVPLTGTTNEQHMREDLDIDDFELPATDVCQLETMYC